MINKTAFSLMLVTVFCVGCKTDQINSSIGVIGTAAKGFTISNEELVAEAKLSAAAMDQQNPIAQPDNAYAKRLEKLTANLKNYKGLNLNYQVYLVKDVNAFAMPDGTVRVFAGLMDLMTDEELVAVIGHEIGHVAEKHSLNQYRKVYLVKATKEGLQSTGGTMGSVVGAYGDIGEAFLNAQFSQSDELSADVYGIHVLKELGMNPYAAVSAQEKLQKLGGGKDSVFSSHPPSQKRIENARKEADAVAK